MVHIITHVDLDGYSGAYVTMEHFGKENCEIAHYNYDRDIDTSSFQKGDTVVITDYSLSNLEYKKILDIIGEDGHLIWCDHHITAIDRYNSEDLELDGLRSTKYCGSLLAWFYFHNYTLEQIESTPYESLITSVPYWLRLVDAWDTWKIDSPYRVDAENLNMFVNDKIAMDLIENIATNPTLMEDYIRIGAIYTDYRDGWANSLRTKYMFRRKLSGHLFNTPRDIDVAVLNIGCASSKYFGEVIDEVDVCITECFDGEKWLVSFYSQKEDINCAFAAKIFGGGGHKGAAGCTFDQQQPPISVGNTEIFRKGENLRWQNLKMKTVKN